MYKGILVIWVLLGVNLYGANKAECEVLFKSAVYNFYIENSCKYNRHLSTTIRRKFENLNCAKIFTEDDIKKINNEVLGSSYKKMNKVGRDNFCKENKIKYDELEKIYLQNPH